MGLILNHFLPIDQPLTTTNPTGKTGLQIQGVGVKEDAHSHTLKGGCDSPGEDTKNQVHDEESPEDHHGHEIDKLPGVPHSILDLKSLKKRHAREGRKLSNKVTL